MGGHEVTQILAPPQWSDADQPERQRQELLSVNRTIGSPIAAFELAAQADAVFLDRSACRVDAVRPRIVEMVA
jgi:hypothetical protein